MSRQTARPLRSRATIEADDAPIFPLEVIQLIASHIEDQSTAASFACVARSFDKLVARQIWSKLDLSIHPHFGDHPRILPRGLPAAEVDDYAALMMTPGQKVVARLWLVDEKEEKWAEKRHRDAVVAKIKAIRASAAKTKRWGMVEEVRIINRGGIVSQTLSLLKAVSRSLRALEIDAPPQFIPGDHRQAKHPDCLEVRMIDQGLSFPRLKHVRIGQLAIRFAEFIPLLCSLAPNLTSVHLDLEQTFASLDDLYEQCNEDADFEFPYMEKNTKVEKMRLSIKFYQHESEDGEMAFNTVDTLLRRSPRMKQLSLRYHGDEPSDLGNLERAMSGMREMADLHVDVYTPYTMNEAKFPFTKVFGVPQFTGLRRLVLNSRFWCEMFDKIHPMPNLESLFLIYWNFVTHGRIPDPPNVQVTPSSSLPITPALAHDMIPSFAEQLRTCPKLRVIHHLHIEEEQVDKNDLAIFDRLDAISNHNGIIRSLRHGDKEVLQAFLWTNYHVDEDVSNEKPYDGMAAYKDVSKPLPLMTTYRARDGTKRRRTYMQRGEGVWQSFTDYEGQEVPLKVIDEMAKVQGLRVGWEGRGVEVGKEAWDVLETWKKLAVKGTKSKK